MEILAHRVADVESLSWLPGKEEGFDLALRLSSSLSQLVMSGGRETNMKHFFKGQAYPSHEFILSLGFSRKKGQKCSLLLFGQVNFLRGIPVLWVRVSHFEFIKTVTQHNQNIVFHVNPFIIKIQNIVCLLDKMDNQ